MPKLSVYRSEDPAAALVLAHGAGAGQQHPFMVSVARALAARRVNTATFDFPYMTSGRKVPDPPAVLERAWREAVEAARADAHLAPLPLFIGGKSMGGRIASQTAAENDLDVAGLVFLGYPLHPPGKPEKRRDAHLPRIRVPMLFVQGTRDAFGTAEEIRALLPRLQRAELFEVNGGDHSFKVPARSDPPQSAVLEAVYDRVAAFVTGK